MDTKYNKSVQDQWPSFLKVKTLTIWRMGKCYLHLQINSCNDFAQMKKMLPRKQEMCPSEHVWPASQHPSEWDATIMKNNVRSFFQWIDNFLLWSSLKHFDTVLRMPLTRLTAEQQVWSYTVAKCLTYKQLPVLHKGKFKST